MSGSLRLADRHAVCAPEDALNAEMAHLNIPIHIESPERAKQHGVSLVRK